jgi:hypothetical protein
MTTPAARTAAERETEPRPQGLEPSCRTLLKEWAATIAAIRDGHQLLLFRKGGIAERDGRFEIEEREFLFFPTFVHQRLESFRPSERARFEASQALGDEAARTGRDGGVVVVDTFGRVEDVRRATSLASLAALRDLHPYEDGFLAERLAWKPREELFVLLVRAYRLQVPYSLAIGPEHAGCRSWVPLAVPRPLAGLVPAVEDGRFESARRSLVDAI